MLIVPPARASRHPATSRPLVIFYGFTLEEATADAVALDRFALAIDKSELPEES